MLTGEGTHMYMQQANDSAWLNAGKTLYELFICLHMWSMVIQNIS